MASAIISGLVNANFVPAKHITVFDHNISKLEKLESLYLVNIQQSIINAPDIIILAVKPHHIKTACSQVYNYIKQDTLIISVAAGIGINQLEQWLPPKTIIIRAMPNTPVSINMGATILYSKLYSNNAEKLFSSLGEVFWVETEQEITAMMAISGCGPAYIFLLCESLLAAAENFKICPKIAKKLITQTIKGANSLYITATSSPSELRAAVTSPNGTTQAAITVLDPDTQKELYIQALQAAVNRANAIEAACLD